MKKILLTIIGASLLSISNPKPAVSGLMVDPAAIAQSFGGTVQKISDTANQVILQYGMLKQLQTQGFSLAALKTLMESELGKYAVGLVKDSIKKRQVKSTKDKEKKLLEKEKDLYADAAKANMDEKLRIAEEDRDNTESELSNKKSELKQKENELKKAEEARERVRNKGGKEEADAIDALEKAQSEYETTQFAVGELEAMLTELKIKVNLVKEEKQVVGTANDPKLQNLETRVEILAQEEEDAGMLETKDLDEKADWAKLENEEAFKIDAKTYKEFIEAYFYEPSADAYKDLKKGKALQTKQQELEAKKDKILRQRKYLIVNTASHLLQVSSSIRREKPMRESAVKKWFDETKEEADEINATTAYSNTRIENARALLLYARLLAAKMQYNAAREINRFDLEKLGKIEDNDYSSVDLGKYILTNEEIRAAVANSVMENVIKGVLGAGGTE